MILRRALDILESNRKVSPVELLFDIDLTIPGGAVCYYEGSHY